MNLTEQQVKLLAFLRVYHAERGIMPNFDEMMAAMELRSKSGIHRILEALHERQKIRRIPSRARSIELLADPDQYSKGFIDGLRRGLDLLQRAADRNRAETIITWEINSVLKTEQKNAA